MFFSDSINLQFLAKKMTILYPTTCVFDKVFLHNLFTEPHNIVPNKSEPEKKFKRNNSSFAKNKVSRTFWYSELPHSPQIWIWQELCEHKEGNTCYFFM